MRLSLVPQPKQVTVAPGWFAMPAKGSVGISDHSLYPEAKRAAALFGGGPIHAEVAGIADAVTLRLDPSLPADGYTLNIGRESAAIAGSSPAAVFYALQTLDQIRRQSPRRRLPRLAIRDAPDFADRGVYYDICRGRVPKLAQLMALARTLAHYKINQLQLYVEHTFAFRGHPDIGRGASPLTAEDILALDACCREVHVELVPSLASFGHLATVLNHPRYRHMAEDWGEGRYVAPDACDIPAWARKKGWTLSPANPRTYAFLESLFAEFLPLFSSRRFNVCCDETADLGMGQSYDLCRRRGRGVVYLDHIRRLRELAARHGKTIMFWGDIIRHHPDLIPRIPKDVTVLDWGYAWNHPFERVEDFRKAGLRFMVCPGTSAWVSLFPRLPEAQANIAGFAAAGRDRGACGLLNTDWGDGGHYNFMEYSFHGYLFGAEQSWNTRADRATFTARFARVFLGTDEPALVRAVRELGEISHLSVAGRYQSVWQSVLFAHRTDPLFTSPQPVTASLVRDGRIVTDRLRFDAACGTATRRRLARIRAVFARCAAKRALDPFGVLPYWIFATDTTDCAARKLEAFGEGGRDTAAAREGIRRQLRALRRRFRSLWLARNRPSEMRVTLARYDLALSGDRLAVAIESAPKSAVRVTVRNPGDRARRVTLRLRLIPATAGEIRGRKEIAMPPLKPGASAAFERRVAIRPERRALLEAVPDAPFANTATLALGAAE